MLLHSLHKPELIEKLGMVYEIWEDGEITLTKSADFYGQRNLHCIVPGVPGVNTPLPVDRGKHSSMVVAEEDIVLARKLILGDTPDPYANCLPGKRLTHEELYAEIRRRNEIYLASA